MELLFSKPELFLIIILRFQYSKYKNIILNLTWKTSLTTKCRERMFKNTNILENIRYFSAELFHREFSHDFIINLTNILITYI